MAAAHDFPLQAQGDAHGDSEEGGAHVAQLLQDQGQTGLNDGGEVGAGGGADLHQQDERGDEQQGIGVVLVIFRKGLPVEFRADSTKQDAEQDRKDHGHEQQRSDGGVQRVGSDEL